MALKLVIDIVEGTNLAPKDSNGFSDPYVYFTGPDGHTHRTETLTKTLCPVWHKSFSFDLKCNEWVTASVKPIIFEVWDYDMLSGDDYMGQVEVDFKAELSGKLDEEVRKVYTLGRKKGFTGKVEGTLTIAAHLES